MRYFFIRFQLIFVSIILLVTFGLLMVLVTQNNRRWDLTREKIYSLSPTTLDLLKEMKHAKIEVFAFFPHDDVDREDFQIFLRESEIHHRNFDYHFYDPNRAPQLAKKWDIRELYTVIVQYRNRQERIVRPDEEAFAGALYRLIHPRIIPICFVTGHEEAGLHEEKQDGMSLWRDILEEKNYSLHEIHLERDGVPSFCQVVVVPGPQRDLSLTDLQLLKETFQGGGNILFLVDPMDPGTGISFKEFMQGFGIRLGSDVVVDKMSRMVGGDFLIPFVDHYDSEHPVTAGFEAATFFPVARSVYPATKIPKDIEIVSIAFSGTGSWAETNLAALEKGEAAFETETDFSGPITLAAVVEEKIEALSAVEISSEEQGKPGRGRMVVVGDSDFLKNAYIHLSGNQSLGLKMIHWLSRDDRLLQIEKPFAGFEPLLLSSTQRLVILFVSLVGYPLLFFVIGCAQIFWRKRKA